MISIRHFRAADTEAVAHLISIACAKWNKRDGSKKAIRDYIDHFRLKKHVHVLRDQFLRAPIHLLAMQKGFIVGVVRGRPSRITGLFVPSKHQRKGIGRRLVQAFERQSIAHGATTIRIRASISAVPFYQAVGYKNSTGIRVFKGLHIQPMKKSLSRYACGKPRPEWRPAGLSLRKRCSSNRTLVEQ